MADSAPETSSNGSAEGSPGGRVTMRTLRGMKRRGDAFACLTCYDATSARWLDRAGVEVLLIGDTAAEMILGYERTIDMPLEIAIALTAAVRRGARRAMVMGDMPFLSYHCGDDESVGNAGRMMTEGQADVVKLEADASFAPLVERMTRSGIAVCGHVGSRPQTAALAGGYGSAGRTAGDAERIVADAVALEQAGAVMLLVEAVPAVVAERILGATSVPLIGIGAGPACDGQILVLHDLVGMTEAPPRFASRSAALGDALAEAGRDWVRRVRARSIGGEAYQMREGELEAFERAMPAAGLPRDGNAPGVDSRGADSR
ncbi:MAG: 3-methyl-2-oxobutanoate hydroxymethyltransferase [Planctomycetota bacterium]